MQMKMNQMMNFARANLKEPESYQFLKSENRYITDTLENCNKYYCLINEIKDVNTKQSRLKFEMTYQKLKDREMKF